jgi:hypothetical protein
MTRSPAAAPPISDELKKYQKLLESPEENGGANRRNSTEEMKMAPLFWWEVKEYFQLSQYGVLGCVPQDDSTKKAPRKPVVLNTSSPWSAFLCGSQGSGKSHSLSCFLENCLLKKEGSVGQRGKSPHPLAGLIFHYDSSQSSGVCEAAYLATEIPTTVLASPSNWKRLESQYSRLNSMYKTKIKVKQLHLLPKYLDTARVKSLMAVGKEGEEPLYMQTITKILREMAIQTGGQGQFNYGQFKNKVDGVKWGQGQEGPLNMRLDLLESFMKKDGSGKKVDDTNREDWLTGIPGELIIIDLADPVIDAESACALFNICHSVFMSQTRAGKIVALDEAHNYMAVGGAQAKQFTETLISSIRQQRHQGVRVVIATQEPSINPKLLDLCNITLVHRCSSPDWFKTLKEHLGGLYLKQSAETADEISPDEDSGAQPATDDQTLFRKIMQLELGESLLFCPSAVIGVDGDGKVSKLREMHVKFRTRQRVTADGGRSVLA